MYNTKYGVSVYRVYDDRCTSYVLFLGVHIFYNLSDTTRYTLNELYNTCINIRP